MISWLVLSSSKMARLTREVYPRLLHDLHQIWRTCPSINEVVYKYTSNMTQNLLIFGMRLEIYLTIICLADGSGVVVPTICQLRSRMQVYWVMMFGIKGINGLQREGWNARRIALSHVGCGRRQQEPATRNCCLQPNGEVRSGWGWDFLEPASSTSQYKLKAMAFM